MRAFFRGAAVMVAVEFLLRIKGLIIMPLLSRHLGTINYGAWAQVSVMVGVVGVVAMMGTDFAVARLLASVDERRRISVFAGLVLVQTAWACLLALALHFGREPLAGLLFNDAAGYADFVSIAGITLISTVLFGTARSWYRLVQDASGLATLTLLQGGLGVLAVVAVLVADLSVMEFLIFNAAIDLLLFLGVAVAVIRRAVPFRPSTDMLPQLLLFGLPFVPGNLAWVVTSMADRAFLVNFRSLEDVGAYSFAYALGYMVIQTLLNPIWNMFPAAAAGHFDRQEKSELQTLFERSAGTMVLVALPAAVGLAVVGDLVIRVMATPDFLPGRYVISMTLLAYCIHLLSGYYEISLGLVYRQYLQTVSYCLGAVVTVGLNFVLTPKWGIIGAATAFLSAQVVMLLFVAWQAQRRKLLRTPLGFPLKVVAAAGCMGAALEGVRPLVSLPPLAELLVLIPAGAALFAGLCLLLRITTPGQVLLVWRTLRRA